MRVALNWSQMVKAASIGVFRHVANVQRGVKDRYGASPKDGWQLNIVGALGEYAVSRAYNLHWDGSLGDYGAPDVGGLVDVRACSEAHHSLILHPGDDDARPFVLVHVDGAACTILGWIRGADGKQRRFWKDVGNGRPAFFVPQSELWSPETLFAVIEDMRAEKSA